MVHVTLLLSLAFYAAFQIHSVLVSAENPPVKVTLEAWKGAGKWAVCGEFDMLGAGMAVVSNTSYEWFNVDDFAVRTLNVGLRLQEIPVAGHPRNCSILDFSEEPVTALPFQMSICSSVTGNGYVLLETNSEWHFVSYLSRNWLRQLYLQRRKQGWNYGYSSDLEELHTVLARFDATYGAPSTSKEYMCGDMQWFQPDRTGPVGSILVSIDSLVTVTHKQGVFPQMIALLSELGGYLSLLTTIFTLSFVRKYPDSPVAKIFEERTFVGASISNYLQGHGKEEKTKDAPVPLPFPWNNLDTE